MTALSYHPACLVCSKPLAGRGKCKSYAHVAIGPRRVGDIVTGYGGQLAEIVSIVEETGDWMGWKIVERDLSGDMIGRVRMHCTAWNPKNDKIVGAVIPVAA